MAPKTEFLFDYASPWAYLANQILGQYLPWEEVQFRPIYLRGLDTFSQGMPYGPSKLRYILADLNRCTERFQVSFRFPDEFPINGIHAVRAATWALQHGGFPDLHARLFEAAWAENRSISNKEVVLDVAAESGIDRSTLAAALDQAALKEEVRQATLDAQNRGAFGVPTFFVGDEMFWGQDRLDYVRDAWRKATAAPL